MLLDSYSATTRYPASFGGQLYPTVGSFVLPVAGAGFFAIGPRSECGGSVGLSLDVSWGKHGYAGGVLDRSDVLRLRDFLSQYLDAAERADEPPRAADESSSCEPVVVCE